MWFVGWLRGDRVVGIGCAVVVWLGWFVGWLKEGGVVGMVCGVVKRRWCGWDGLWGGGVVECFSWGGGVVE